MATKKDLKTILEDMQIKILEHSVSEAEAKKRKAEIEEEKARVELEQEQIKLKALKDVMEKEEEKKKFFN